MLRKGAQGVKVDNEYMTKTYKLYMVFLANYLVVYAWLQARVNCWIRVKLLYNTPSIFSLIFVIVVTHMKSQTRVY